MSKDEPSPREQTVLHLIRRHTNETGGAPTTQWLADALRGQDIDDASAFPQWSERERKSWQKNVLTIIGRLERKGLIVRRGGHPHLTSRADSYFASLYEGTEIASHHEVVPATVPVRGRVRAGRGTDLAVDMSSSATSIPIPDARQERKTYALEVEGASMEHEGIRAGDYVVIEEFRPSEGPRSSELIVTMYVEGTRSLEAEMDVDITEEGWSGPTLKYYYEVEDKQHNAGCRLGWKKDNSAKEYMIWPTRIRPIGRVIGMYRRLRMA